VLRVHIIAALAPFGFLGGAESADVMTQEGATM